MDNGNVPIIGAPKPEEIYARGKKIIVCAMDGNNFAWMILDELAKRISKADAETLISQLREALHRTCAKNGNILT